MCRPYTGKIIYVLTLNFNYIKIWSIFNDNNTKFILNTPAYQISSLRHVMSCNCLNRKHQPN